MKNSKFPKFLLTILLCVIYTFSAAGCGGQDKYVKLVREGSLKMEKDVPIGKAFDSFFGNGTWQSFESTDGQRVVQFDGDFRWENKPVKGSIQFIIHGEDSFELGAVSVNEVERNRLESLAIVERVLTDYRMNKTNKN